MRNSQSSIRTATAMAVAVLIGVMPIQTKADEPSFRSHIVHIRNLQFSPGDLVVAPGDTVTWINHDLAPHTITADDKSWSSGRLDSDDRWELVVHEGTRETYFCRYHPSMKARLHVRRPSIE